MRIITRIISLADQFQEYAGFPKFNEPTPQLGTLEHFHLGHTRHELNTYCLVVQVVPQWYTHQLESNQWYNIQLLGYASTISYTMAVPRQVPNRPLKRCAERRPSAMWYSPGTRGRS